MFRLKTNFGSSLLIRVVPELQKIDQWRVRKSYKIF